MTNAVQEERLQRRFQLWDRDGDGRIDRSDWENEAQRILRAFETAPSSDRGEAVLTAYLGMWDYLAGHAGIEDGGSLGFDQFRDLAGRQLLDRGPEGFDEVLRPTIGSIVGLCDTDGDGQVDPEEFRSWIRAIGSPEETAETAFQAIDADGDGKLTVEELVQAVHKYHAGELDVALL
ncbi:EF-hand domain-containing protein [Streptomyces benahoarensis]|uniref:EF-hand domain-containing protein n=1 Tax=Streptomyces benahoarensis TaxID=2595054 RepID=A0A553ZLP3_9ACTN|nr:EF-hand domain-containing protein [Streptomyces benahoarensis]TSB23358.1 EF-hand domain-containing protein [Streptomyces benahoarensis]TSB42367.1 EF-hand domain-containing protein [Streptomyces benahoarensis]